MNKRQAYHALRQAKVHNVVLADLERINPDLYVYRSPWSGKVYLVGDTHQPKPVTYVTKGECNVNDRPTDH